VWLIDLDIKKLRQRGPQDLVATLQTVMGCVAGRMPTPRAVVQGVEDVLFVRPQERLSRMTEWIACVRLSRNNHEVFRPCRLPSR